MVALIYFGIGFIYAILDHYYSSKYNIDGYNRHSGGIQTMAFIVLMFIWPLAPIGIFVKAISKIAKGEKLW